MIIQHAQHKRCVLCLYCFLQSLEGQFLVMQKVPPTLPRCIDLDPTTSPTNRSLERCALRVVSLHLSRTHALGTHMQKDTPAGPVPEHQHKVVVVEESQKPGADDVSCRRPSIIPIDHHGSVVRGIAGKQASSGQVLCIIRCVVMYCNM